MTFSELTFGDMTLGEFAFGELTFGESTFGELTFGESLGTIEVSDIFNKMDDGETVTVILAADIAY
jgi:hypothetical protein